MSQIWTSQPDGNAIANAHMGVVLHLDEINSGIVCYPPLAIVHMSLLERAKRYEQLAACYNTQLAFKKLGICTKMWAIYYASIAILFLEKTSKTTEQLGRLQSFIDRISQKHGLNRNSFSNHRLSPDRYA